MADSDKDQAPEKPEPIGKVGKNSPPVATRFKKGNKGGPGRPSTQGFRQFLSEVSDPATGKDRRYFLWQSLYSMAIDKYSRHRFAALELALAYDMNKPMQGMELSGPDGGAIETEDKTKRAPTTGEMRRELAAIEARRMARIGAKSLPAATPVELKADAKAGNSED